MRSLLTVSTALILSATSLTACRGSGGGGGATKAASGAYDVQIVGSITGTSNTTGLPTAAGAQTVFKMVNAAGGVNGHKINYKVLDDQSSVTVAPQVGQSALAENPTAIIDASYSTFLTPRMNAYKTARIPVVANNSTLEYDPWLYSTSPTVAQAENLLAAGAAEAAGGSLRGKSVAVIIAATPSGDSFASGIGKIVAAQGGRIAVTERQPAGATTFDSGAAAIVHAKADVTIDFDSTASVIVENKALATSGFTGNTVAYTSSSDPTTFAAIASPHFYAERVVGSATSGTAMYTAAKKYGFGSATDNAYFGIGWVIGYTIVQTLTKCGSPCSPADFEKTLNGFGSYTVPGDVLFGPLKVSASNHNIIGQAQLYKWDAASHSSVKVGGLLPAGAPNYPSGS